MNFKDNKDFYPTPIEVIEQMIFGLDLKDKYVLEPSAGSGNIVDILNDNNAKVLACENDETLIKLLARKCKFLKEDFLTVTREEVSHIDYIIANPPFSCQNDHILHMWEIAPDGCQIIFICNNVLFDNYQFCSDHTERKVRKKQDKIQKLVKEHGSKDYIGNCFSDAERETDVKVSLVRIFKPKLNDDFEFDGYFDMSENCEYQEDGIMGYNVVRDIVNRYVGAVKMFDSVMAKANEINELMKPLNDIKSISFGAYRSSGNNYTDITRDEFKKDLQKNAWHSVFNKLNMSRFVTKSALELLNKFVEQQENVPFTMINIQTMVNHIIGTHRGRMDDILIEVFDRITKHSHENRYQVEGWKTNGAYFVGKKFILNSVINSDYNGLNPNYYHTDNMNDMMKAFCVVQGIQWNENMSFYTLFKTITRGDVEQGKMLGKNLAERECITYNKWFDWEFFECKVFKKGTMHCKFKSDELWADFNIKVAKLKGWNGLPEKIK